MENKENNRVHLSVLNTLQNEYIPLPEFKKVRGKHWIPYGSYTNEFARELIYNVQNSELHGSIISTKAKMIAGEVIITPDDLQTKLFIEKINPYESLEQMIYKWAWDLETFGSFCINVLWDKAHEKIVNLYHTDASRVLYSPKNEKGFIDTYFYSEDWTRYRQSEYIPIEIPAFKTSKDASELLVSIPSYQAGMSYYTYPDYVAAIDAIKLDIKILDAHNANIDNNFQAGKVITFIAEMPDEEKMQEIREQLEAKQSGAGNAGRTMIVYSRNKESAPIIEVIPNDGLDSMFLTLSNDVRSRILTGHGITSPLLVGITTPGQLGGSNELAIAKDLFYKYRILPKRAYILNTINDLLRINGLKPIIIEDNEEEVVETVEKVEQDSQRI